MIHRPLGLAASIVALQHDNGGWALRELGPWPQWEGSDGELPEFRSQLYARDGHMWSFLVQAAYRKQKALWATVNRSGPIHG